MSKKETPLTLWYWNQIGGQLTEEFMAVQPSRTTGKRLLDGVVLLKKAKERLAQGSQPNLGDEDIVVIQTKYGRLGMYLMGQTLFSRDLALRFKPKSVLSIALCTQNDALLAPMLEKHEGCKVVICPPEIADSLIDAQQ